MRSTTKLSGRRNARRRLPSSNLRAGRSGGSFKNVKRFLVVAGVGLFLCAPAQAHPPQLTRGELQKGVEAFGAYYRATEPTITHCRRGRWHGFCTIQFPASFDGYPGRVDTRIVVDARKRHLVVRSEAFEQTLRLRR